MIWLFPALLAPLLWAASNIIDERLVKNTSLDAWALVLLSGAFASLPASLLFVSQSIWPGGLAVLLAVTTGSLGIFVYYPYFKALVHETASSVLLMWNLTPVLIAGLARALVGERLSITGFVAIILLVSSSLIAAYRRSPKSLWSDALPWMVGASVLLAVSSVMEKAVYQRMPFRLGLAWISTGALLTTVLVSCIASRSRTGLVTSLRQRLGAVLIANQGLDLGAVCMLGLATSLGPVSLVHAVEGIQPVFVIIIYRILGRRPGSRAEFLRSSVAAGLAVVGLGLLHSAS